MALLAPDLPQVESAIVELTNAFRAEQKLAPVKPNPQLAAAARRYAQFLAASGVFSHTADGRQHADRIAAAGYQFCVASENLSYNFDERSFAAGQLAANAVDGWKKSPGHRHNLLEPHVTDIGIGAAKAAGSEKYYLVQLFGRPGTLRYSFKVQNGLTQPVAYAFAGRQHAIAPREVVTHHACTPAVITFERAGPPLFGRALSGSYQTRDGDLFTLKPAGAGGVVIDLSRPVLPGRTGANP